MLSVGSKRESALKVQPRRPHGGENLMNNIIHHLNMNKNILFMTQYSKYNKMHKLLEDIGECIPSRV